MRHDHIPPYILHAGTHAAGTVDSLLITPNKVIIPLLVVVLVSIGVPKGLFMYDGAGTHTARRDMTEEKLGEKDGEERGDRTDMAG